MHSEYDILKDVNGMISKYKTGILNKEYAYQLCDRFNLSFAKTLNKDKPVFLVKEMEVDDFATYK